MERILFVYRRSSSFVEIDRELLSERWAVDDLCVSRGSLNPFSLMRRVWRSDLVFGWFAYWHTFLPVTLAWLLRKPSVLVIGGYDTAADEQAGYGLQRGGPRQWISRWTMKRASALIVNSNFTRDEAVATAKVDPNKLTVVHHGIPDPFGEVSGRRERVALTVGVVDQRNLTRKGLKPFAEAAALLPDVEFVVAGRDDGAADQLDDTGRDNLRVTGWLETTELLDLYRSSSVYVQASTHEGFGMSVAEAMLAGCIPVTTRDGALPEVVGDTGVQIDGQSAEQIAAGVELGLQANDDQRRKARERVLERFTIEQRRVGIGRVVEAALGRVRS